MNNNRVCRKAKSQSSRSYKEKRKNYPLHIWNQQVEDYRYNLEFQRKDGKFTFHFVNRTAFVGADRTRRRSRQILRTWWWWKKSWWIYLSTAGCRLYFILFLLWMTECVVLFPHFPLFFFLFFLFYFYFFNKKNEFKSLLKTVTQFSSKRRSLCIISLILFINNIDIFV